MKNDHCLFDDTLRLNSGALRGFIAQRPLE